MNDSNRTPLADARAAASMISIVIDALAEHADPQVRNALDVLQVAREKAQAAGDAIAASRELPLAPEREAA